MPVSGHRTIEFASIDASDPDFNKKFDPYRLGFLRVLSSAYGLTYYGDEYHLNRIMRGRAMLYTAFDAGEVIGASYVKRNRRRGGTAVYPEHYRGLGVAESLVRLSFADFPTQYSIVEANSRGMIDVLEKVGFKRATSIGAIQAAATEDFRYLLDFDLSHGYVIFNRRSLERGCIRKGLLLLSRDADASDR